MASATEPSAGTVRPTKRSSTLRNILSNWLSFFITAVVSFFLSPFIVRHLGNSGYGIWTLTMSVTGYLGLLDMGVRGAVTRYVAKFHTKSADEDASRVVSSGLAIFLAAGAIAIVVSVGLALFVVVHLRIPESFQFAAKVVLILSGINIAVSLASGVFGGVVVALQRFDLNNAVEITGTALRTIAILLLLSRGKGLISLAVIQLTFAIIGGAVTALLAFRLYPRLRVHFSQCDKENLKMIFSFSFYSFLLQISGYLIFYTDSVVIGAFLPISAITFFAIAGNLMNYSRGLLSGISTTAAPVAAVLEAKGEQAELRRVLLKGTRYASMLFFPIGIAFLLRGSSFIGLWMGPSYAALSGKVLAILTVAQLLASGDQVSGSMTLGIGRHRWMVPPAIFEGVLNLGMSIALVRHYGIVGVAVGTAVPNLLVHLFFWPWYVHHVYGVKPTSYVFSTWILPAIAVLPYAVATYATEKWWPAKNLLMFFGQIACVLPLALVAFWFICVTPEDRAAYSRKVFGRLSRA
jgi:O-antigen/teichoic acid export membrane protein